MKSHLNDMTNPLRITVMYPVSFMGAPVVYEFPWSAIMTLEEAQRYGWENGKDEVPLRVLENVFRQCNHVDDNEWIAGKKLRSMSVGDIVFLDSVMDKWEPMETQVWVCSGMGWKKLEDLEIVP